jgi:hypothetical protein
MPALDETPFSELTAATNGSAVVPKATYETLVRKFNRLYQNHCEMSSARAQLEKALIAKKEEVRKCRDIYDSLRKEIGKRKAKIDTMDGESKRSRAQNQNASGRSRISEGIGTDFLKAVNDEEFSISVPTEKEFISNELPMLVSGGDNSKEEKAVDAEFGVLEPYATSSTPVVNENTFLDELKPTDIKQGSSTDTLQSPDAPVVISSRSVPKARSHRGFFESKQAPKVKIEIGSSPIGLAALNSWDESIDLDDIGTKQITPRKCRLFLQQELQTSSSIPNTALNESGNQRHASSNCSSNTQTSQDTPTHQIGVKRKASVLQPGCSSRHILPRTSAEKAQKRRRFASDQAISDVTEDGELIESIDRGSRKRNTPASEQAKLLVNLLEKVSPTKPVLIPTQPTIVQEKPRRPGDSVILSRAHEVLRDIDPNSTKSPLPKGLSPVEIPRSNGGSLIPSRPTSKGGVRSSVEPSRPSSTGSLRSSIEPHRPLSSSTFRHSDLGSRPTSRESSETRLGLLKQVMSPLRTPAPAKAQKAQQATLRSTRTIDQLARDRSLTSANIPAQSRMIQGIGTPSRPRNQPLRTRPVNELTLQDFKVNPKYNQGYGYAFREVVRNQADRRCLPGCTKSECCGAKFRVLAEAARDLKKDPTASQEEADERLLEEFLGDNSYKLRNMTKAERDETLMRALTRDLANNIGKHRHAFERRQSPPGFWRSDFPNTQEQLQDRAKAEQLEREQICHRYEEAMRRGAYIFRDE